MRIEKVAAVLIWFFSFSLIGVMNSSCWLFGRDPQPAVNEDPRAIQRFNASTNFPYDADEVRRDSILANAPNIRLGMNGEEIITVLGSPDEAHTLADPGGTAWGYSWTYSIKKQFARAPDNADIFIEIVFDRNGIVKGIDNQLSGK